MGKKTESRISLSLKDLERLGVIKKRLKRKRKNKKLTKVLDTLIGGAKSDSSHMKGYTNQFTNTSNLNTEGQRLQNQLLGEAHEKQRKALEYLSNKNDDFEKHTSGTFNFLLNNIPFNNTPFHYNPLGNENRVEELQDEDNETPKKTRFTDTPNRTQFYNTDDDIDVPQSVSSEDFEGSPVPTKTHLQSIDEKLTPPNTQSPLQNNRFSATQSLRYFSPFSGMLNPKPQNENPIIQSPLFGNIPTADEDLTKTTTKPKLKRQTSAEKFTELQDKYYDEGIPSSLLEKAENTRQLNSLVNKYKEIEKFKGYWKNREYYIDNIDSFTLPRIKSIVEQQKKKN
jgi:hypothetical protein